MPTPTSPKTAITLSYMTATARKRPSTGLLNGPSTTTHSPNVQSTTHKYKKPYCLNLGISPKNPAIHEAAPSTYQLSRSAHLSNLLNIDWDNSKTADWYFCSMITLKIWARVLTCWMKPHTRKITHCFQRNFWASDCTSKPSWKRTASRAFPLNGGISHFETSLSPQHTLTLISSDLIDK
jgi:hypothetical protein